MGVGAILIGNDFNTEGRTPEEIESVREQRKEFERLLKELAAHAPQSANVELGSEDVLYCEHLGSDGILYSLRSYAAYLERNGEPPTQGNVYHQELDDLYKGKWETTRFRHLIDHGDTEGWYFPADFSLPLWIAAYGSKEPNWCIGSSIRLLDELEYLKKFLGVEYDLGEFEDLGKNAFKEVKGDPFMSEKWVWIVLHWLARESVKQKLIILFNDWV